MSRTLFYTFLAFYTSAIVYLANTIPIGPHEATVYYTDEGTLYFLTHLLEHCFNDSLAFRLPFVFFGFLNIPLFYIMSRLYFDNVNESYLATSIYLLLPGIITSTILVNISVLVITFVLLFIIFYEKKILFGEAFTMFSLLLLHDASIIFFIALAIFFAVKQKQKRFVIALMFAMISLYFNGLDIGGIPTGEFLQLFGLYMALFSPLVFLYFFYALYRISLREKKDILWYISFTAFIFSILLSLRQQVDMTDFAPYVVVSVVLMLLTYYKSICVRLPQFQKAYRFGFNIVLVSLIFSSSIILFHPIFFMVIDEKSKHFAYPFYEPYWQVSELHEIRQKCYTVKKKKIQYQLKYYGIEKCEESTVPKIHR
jgi:hypothetical protein